MAVNGMDITGHLKKGEVNLGTSIMAVAYDKGVILGADSRTTMGSYIANRVTDKLTHLSDRIYCCRSGSAADTQAIADIVTYYLDMYSVESDTPPATKVAANLFQEIVYQNKDRLSAGIIVAGGISRMAEGSTTSHWEEACLNSHGQLVEAEVRLFMVTATLLGKPVGGRKRRWSS